MINQLHWLLLSARIQLKILVLVLKCRPKLVAVPKYLREDAFSPLGLSAPSHKPLSSFDWQVLFVSRVRSARLYGQNLIPYQHLAIPLESLPSLLLILLSGSLPASSPS